MDVVVWTGPSRARLPRRALPGRLVACVLLAATAACAGLEPRGTEALCADVDGIAARLVESAQQRSDLRQVRVWVAEFRDSGARTLQPAGRGERADVLGARLENEFVIALASRLNVVESELAGPSLAVSASAGLEERAAAHRATHVVVGDYVRRKDTVSIAVRLVDAESLLIVAAARGEVRLDALANAAELGRLAREVPEGSGPARAPGGTRVVAASQPQAAAPYSGAGAAAPAPASATEAPRAPASIPPATILPASSPQPARSASPAGSLAPPKPVEDFETWRKRRRGELPSSIGAESGAGARLDALAEEARARSDPTVQARRNELLAVPGDEADPFPWRRYAWLARLLQIPASPAPAER